MNKGVLYIATGDDFLEECKISAKTLKETVDNIPVSVVTNQDIQSPYFDTVITIDNPSFGFEDQLTGMKRTPYDKTLCLDTDIYIFEDFSEIFGLLDEYDIAAALNPIKHGSEEYNDVPASFPEYNTGVLAYRDTKKVREFIKSWKGYYEAEPQKSSTEPAFRRALFHSDLRNTTLSPEYNCQIRHPGKVVGTVKIFHGRLTDVEVNSDRLARRHHYDIEEAAEKINSYDQPRVFTQLGGLKVYSNKTHLLRHRIRLALERGGIRYTAKQALRKLISQ